MKCIKITEFSAPIGQEYVAASYPGAGFYYSRTLQNLYQVYIPAGGSALCVLGMWCVPPEALVEMPEMITAEFAPTTSYTEDFILKALAIAQSPQLAVSLTK